MTRTEAVVLVAVALVLLVIAATLLFGPYGLAGAGVVLLVVALFGPMKEDAT